MFSHARTLRKLSLLLLIFTTARTWAADVDGDGITDDIDLCLNTPAGITVDPQGRPIGDLDHDCDVDQSDYGIFQANMTGPLTPCSTEACDNIDNDCDTLIDEENATGCTTYYADNDGDGYGSFGPTQCLCAPAAPYTATQDGDCYDNDPTRSARSCHPVCQRPDDNDPCICNTYNPGTIITCGTGACFRSVNTCTDGQLNTCTPGSPSPEICDHVDNNCDGTQDNVSPPPSSVDHCGQCFNACPTRPNATRTCTNGVCGFTCNSGYGNCNGFASDGCETNLLTNEDHCGSCNNDCVFLTCRNGVCGF